MLLGSRTCMKALLSTLEMCCSTSEVVKGSNVSSWVEWQASLSQPKTLTERMEIYSPKLFTTAEENLFTSTLGSSMTRQRKV